MLCDLWHHSQVLHARPGEALGRNAAQAVTDNVKRFAKNGWDAPMEEWKKCKTWEAKREFALKLATDKTASFIRVTQTESLKSQSEVSDVTGWQTESCNTITARSRSRNIGSPLFRSCSQIRDHDRRARVSRSQGCHQFGGTCFADEHKDEIKKITLFDTAWSSGRRQSRHSAFEESALDESCERNKVDVAESSRRSRKGSGTI